MQARISRQNPSMAPPASQPQASDNSNRPPGGEPERPGTGEQHVIPGTEKISYAEVAKRKVEEPLRPKAEQKPADEGLFGDGANQTDLVDLAGRPKAAKP
jgi:hypothetical protein